MRRNTLLFFSLFIAYFLPGESLVYLLNYGTENLVNPGLENVDHSLHVLVIDYTEFQVTSCPYLARIF